MIRKKAFTNLFFVVIPLELSPSATGTTCSKQSVPRLVYSRSDHSTEPGKKPTIFLLERCRTVKATELKQLNGSLSKCFPFLVSPRPQSIMEAQQNLRVFRNMHNIKWSFNISNWMENCSFGQGNWIDRNFIFADVDKGVVVFGQFRFCAL